MEYLSAALIILPVMTFQYALVMKAISELRSEIRRNQQ